jgi:hypothetical protein
MLKIAGVTVKTPSELKIGRFDITKSNRAASGKMIMELIATKRRVDCIWTLIADNELQLIIDTITANKPFFILEYPDVGINHRLSLIYKEKMVPTLIRLGKKHTRLFWKECGHWYIPRHSTKPNMGNIIWVPEKNCYCYKSRVLIPMRFNDPSIYGIVVEGQSASKSI